MGRWLGVMVAMTVLSAASAGAFCPGWSPPTLWDHARDSTLVVFAHVDSVSTQGDFTTARLSVKSTWVGESSSALTVASVQDDNMCCGGDAAKPLRPGTDGVFFLEKSVQGFGVREVRDGLSDERLAATRDVVLLARRLGAGSAGRLAWIVEALKHLATQRDAIAELPLVEDGRRLHYDDYGLTFPTRRALAVAFTRAPVADKTLLEVMILLRSHDDESLNAALADAMETLLVSEPTPDWSLVALEEFQKRFPSVHFEPRLSPTDSWAVTKTQLSLTPQLISTEAVVVTPLPREIDDELFPPEPPPKAAVVKKRRSR